MSALKDLKLYATHPHPCSYLEGQQAKTLFIDPEVEISVAQHSRLSEIGFRRSGDHLYRPWCDHCQACMPCRIVVDDFHPTRSYRRILKRNSDLQVSQTEDIETAEYYALYQRYIRLRHQDGDMFPPSWEQYRSFLGARCDTTVYHAFRHKDGQLLGLMVSDQLDHGLSAVYTFFEPEEQKRSLGTWAILWQIEECRKLGLPYLYLGYFIRDCQKMAYKQQFRPQELLLKGRWVRLT